MIFSKRNIGKKCFWYNVVDPSFTGHYIIVSEKDEKGYIDIYNDKKGKRTVPFYYLKNISV